ncbi:MAG: DUF3368 domain-containing protein [Chthoniobacterales bacterium]|nr:DUF3368 domain-containing protein [Chthoniobacterales bacterium]
MSSLKCETLIICDASPLILLAKIDKLSLLKVIAEEVWVPTAVWDELVIDAELHDEIEKFKIFLSCIRSPDPTLERAFQLEVDRGEAAALALAVQNPNSCLLIDDRTGRTIAQLQGVKIIGTLGLLVRAKRHGLISEIKPLFDNLKNHGWFISSKLLNEALKAVGE